MTVTIHIKDKGQMLVVVKGFFVQCERGKRLDCRQALSHNLEHWSCYFHYRHLASDGIRNLLSIVFFTGIQWTVPWWDGLFTFYLKLTMVLSYSSSVTKKSCVTITSILSLYNVNGRARPHECSPLWNTCLNERCVTCAFIQCVFVVSLLLTGRTEDRVPQTNQLKYVHALTLH